MGIIDLQKGSGKRSSQEKVSEKSGNFDMDNEWQPWTKQNCFYKACNCFASNNDFVFGNIYSTVPFKRIAANVTFSSTSWHVIFTMTN